MKLLDLFCGRFGWSRAFAARGWECVGVDLVEPPEVPVGCKMLTMDILRLEVRNGEIGFNAGTHWAGLGQFDFICASSPCEQFSKFGLKCFYLDPPFPTSGMRLFNHTMALCEASRTRYVMENVRAAQAFVGDADNHCGPFYLWGTGVPAILPQGILKGRRLKTSGYKSQTGLTSDRKAAAHIATIPPELANCVADYAEHLLEMRTTA